MDAGNMLKPMLARGELHMIGATTLDEYRKHIESDAALERRFQPVMVDEPTRRGHHLDPARPARAPGGVPRREDPGQRAGRRGDAVSHRYITDRFLPDKAIDLVDEACARLRTEIDSMPAELDELTRRVTRLEIEEAALAKETDPASQARLDELRRELADLRGRGRRQAGPVGGRAPGDPAGPGAARGTGAGPAGGRGGRARLRPEPGRRAALRRDPPSWSGGWPPRRSNSPPSRASSGCCARWSPRTRSPRSSRPGPASRSSRLQEGEREKLLRLDEILRERVVGQDEAVTAGRRRDHPGPLRHPGPAPADRVVHLPRPHRRRQDRAGQDAGRGAVRHRGQHGPARHERVPGTAHRQPAGRRAARLRRLRGGRPAHRGGAPQAVLGGAVRRDREGAPRRLQHAAAGAGRRPDHRRAGPHGRTSATR